MFATIATATKLYASTIETDPVERRTKPTATRFNDIKPSLTEA